MKTIYFLKIRIKLLPKTQQESYETAKICYICKEEFKDKYPEDTKYRKVRDDCNNAGE